MALCLSSLSCQAPVSFRMHGAVGRPACCVTPRFVGATPRRQIFSAIASVDPWANRTVYEPGFTLPIHSEEQLDKFLSQDKLVVTMCKSSHCRPCKKFMQTYHQLAERFPDCVLLEVTGDESPELRKLMLRWGIKTTPTFNLYRGGALVATVTGISGNKLLNAMLDHLQDGERGRDWVDITHESMADFDMDNE